VTEEEAKTKWCPFARCDHNATNRANPGPNADMTAGWAPCIASACMAWRKRTVLIVRMTGERAIPGVAAQGTTEERYSGEGYCGLAGAPA